MIRDILNYLGEKLGELELPDETSEDVWAAKLAPYAKHPPSPSCQMRAALSRLVEESRKFADEIIEEIKRENLAMFIENSVPPEMALGLSMHVHHRLRAVSISYGGQNYVIDIMNLIISGDLETAYYTLALMEPDEVYFTPEKIQSLMAKISARISI